MQACLCASAAFRFVVIVTNAGKANLQTLNISGLHGLCTYAIKG